MGVRHDSFCGPWEPFCTIAASWIIENSPLLMKRVYLDYISGTPLLPEAQAAMSAWLERVGNPSNHLHREGRVAAAALERARKAVAALIGASADEIYFTSSGTEANTWAIRGLVAAHRTKGKHLVLSAVEHISLLHTVRRLEREGYEVTHVPVDATGRVDAAQVERVLRPDTALVSVMWANHEVGTLQPIAEIARLVRARGVLFHTDAVAAVGSVEVSVTQTPVDALSLAANQFGGPAGVGALYVREGVGITPLFDGGIQEHGRRAGTENLLSIIGTGAAAEVIRQQQHAWFAHRRSLRDALEQALRMDHPACHVFGHPTERLPGHLCVAFEGIDGESLALGLDREGVAVVQSSACTSKVLKASHVLKAMGVPEPLAQGACLASIGWETTPADIEQARAAFHTVVQQLHSLAVVGPLSS